MLAPMQTMPKLTMRMPPGISCSTRSAPVAAPHSPMTPHLRASEIIPRLYVSDLSVAESARSLSALGVTHVLTAMRGVVAVPSGAGLTRLQLPLDDFPFAELVEHLPAAVAFMRDALADPNACVLVHCAQGVSRSTSVVAAYLMVKFDWTTEQAVQYIKTKRRIAEPNFGFVSQLQEFRESMKRVQT